MTIGLDCRLPAYRMGGISQYILHLLPALASLDPARRFLVGHSRRDTRDHRPRGAANFDRCTLWTPPHHRLERWALGLEVAARRPALWHSPDFIPPAFGAGAYVITVHDLNFIYFPEFLTPESRRYYAGQIDWAVRHADHVVADSDHTRRDLVERLGVDPNRVTTVPLAANPSYAVAPPSASVDETLSRLGLERGYLLFVGTLEPRKNLPRLVEAYGRLRGDLGVVAPLVLVGATGWLAGDIWSTVARWGLEEHVRHIDDADDATLARLYAGAGALALPSLYEGFGLPALEAMLLGCPVVASDRASLPEVVGDAGLLLPPEDVDAWVAGLSRVLADGALRERLAAAGRTRAAQFSWERTAAATLAVYDAVLAAST